MIVLDEKKKENRIKTIVSFLCVISFVSVAMAIGYEGYSYSVTNANSAPVFFENEAAKLNKTNVPILFIGLFEGNPSEYLKQYQLKQSRSVGITYVMTGGTVLYTNPYVTYWDIIAISNGITVRKIATIKYERPDFYDVKAVTNKGIFFARESFMESDIPIVCVIIGGMIGAVSGVGINNKREKQKDRAKTSH